MPLKYITTGKKTGNTQTWRMIAEKKTSPLHQKGLWDIWKNTATPFSGFRMTTKGSFR
jgi:hypothetical protein